MKNPRTRPKSPLLETLSLCVCVLPPHSPVCLLFILFHLLIYLFFFSLFISKQIITLYCQRDVVVMSVEEVKEELDMLWQKLLEIGRDDPELLMFLSEVVASEVVEVLRMLFVFFFRFACISSCVAPM